MQRFVRNFLFVASLAAMSMLSMAQDLKITFTLGLKKQDVHYHSQRYSRFNYEQDKEEFLVDYQDSVTYSIDHRAKTVLKRQFSDMEDFWRSAKSNAKGAKNFSQAQREALGDPDDVSVEKSTASVVGRECEKYEITVGKAVCTIYLDTSLESFADRDAAMRSFGIDFAIDMIDPILGSIFTNLFIERSKIRGIVLKEEWRLPWSQKPVFKSYTTEAVSIEEGPLPDSVFDLPKHYKHL